MLGGEREEILDEGTFFSISAFRTLSSLLACLSVDRVSLRTHQFGMSSWMNVYYISKHKKLFGEENGLRLLWNEGGSRGWQSIDSEAGGIESKAWQLGMKKLLPSTQLLCFYSLGRMYIISPNTKSFFAMRKSSVSYELREVGSGVGKTLILRWGDESKAW